MATEVERKFLVASEAWRREAEEVHTIRQFYLMSAPDRTLRVRLKGGHARLTLKFGGHQRVREEFEFPVPFEEARKMEAFALGNVIEKERHLVRHRGRLYEVDVFGGALSGLVIAELETAETMADEDLPAWLGPEVTGRPAYYNASLALNGLPERAA
ncbi:CYTH domain-containing protein [Chelativorans intermedius]|uniref:CYTH domain-containing protein n=1 Tax=Chelativorans intermedius TaxID=515947 RepID=A0ABV6DDB0_9HYPH|nr:CYTH domain-containing protein [Chelativorans intermedius]MCT8998313.1 CYTH domain-containing protein [Chelativorans intermedius]